MSRLRASNAWRGALGAAVLAVALLSACGRGGAGTGGSGAGPNLEIAQILSNGTPVSPRRTFLAPSERLTLRARLTGAPGLDSQIQWIVTPANPQTGPAALLSPLTGPEITFRAVSKLGRLGSRDPNPPLEYNVTATVIAGGKTLQAQLTPKTPLRQVEADILRQEYQDYGTRFQPALANVSPPVHPSFNTGNYTVIAEGRPGGLEDLLTRVTQKANSLLNSDVQKQPVGTKGITPDTVVVAPGPPIRNVGALGNTDPKGDDVCAGPMVKGRCGGPIKAGPNGIAETPANNRGAKLNVESLITSAFRNPQRNTAAGSKALNSLHTAGLALDLDPRTIDFPGKTSDQLMCVLEQAGDLALGKDGVSFTEHGATTFLDCNNPQADHVHVNFNLP